MSWRKLGAQWLVGTLVAIGLPAGAATAASGQLPLNILRAEAERVGLRPSLVLAMMRAEDECDVDAMLRPRGPGAIEPVTGLRFGLRRLVDLGAGDAAWQAAVYAAVAGHDAAALGIAAATPAHRCFMSAVHHWSWQFQVYDAAPRASVGTGTGAGGFRDWECDPGSPARVSRGRPHPTGRSTAIDGRP